MKTILAICAESATIDQTTNGLSLLNVLEELSGAGFPGMVPRVAFVIVFERKATERENIAFQFSITHNGTLLFETPIKASFQGRLRLRSITNIQGVPILAPGSMVFSAKQKGGKDLGSWSVVITDVSQLKILPPAIQITAATNVQPKTVKPKKKKKRRRS